MDEFGYISWPTMPDGSEFDGRNLLQLHAKHENPFAFNLQALLNEVEETLVLQIMDISMVGSGANRLGFSCITSNTPIIVLLDRNEIYKYEWSMWRFDLYLIEQDMIRDIPCILEQNPLIPCSKLLYSRKSAPAPNKAHTASGLETRSVLVFDRFAGEKNIFEDLGQQIQLGFLTKIAELRAALYAFGPPRDFVDKYLHARLANFTHDPESLPAGSRQRPRVILPTREFWLAEISWRICHLIRNLGHRIGWESDNDFVTAPVLESKATILEALSYIMPPELPDNSLYRFVLEHEDYGLHNILAEEQEDDGVPRITALFDWDTACIWPALLSNPLVKLPGIEVTVDKDGNPALSYFSNIEKVEDLEKYGNWARRYVEDLFTFSPQYKTAILAGKDIRHLWYALKDWRGKDSVDFFGGLAGWAKGRMEAIKKENGEVSVAKLSI